MLWDVISNGRIIDTVSYDNGISADEVRRSLISHDMYPGDIEVIVHSQPLYDMTYIAEKANLILRGANTILDTINKPQTKNTRSFYVAGILDIEIALNGLHNKIRQVMQQCNETEDDYMLRHLGEIKFGK